MEEKKHSMADGILSWCKKHWIITAILVLVVLSSFMNSVTPEDKKSPLQQCNDLCGKLYDAGVYSRGQADVCQTSCSTVDYYNGENATRTLVNSLKELLVNKTG